MLDFNSIRWRIKLRVRRRKNRVKRTSGLKDMKVLCQIMAKMERLDAGATVTYGATVSYGGAELVTVLAY